MDEQREAARGLGAGRREMGLPWSEGAHRATTIRKAEWPFPKKEKPRRKRNKTNKLVGINSKGKIPLS